MVSVLNSFILAVHSDKPVLHGEARQLLLVSLPLCLEQFMKNCGGFMC